MFRSDYTKLCKKIGIDNFITLKNEFREYNQEERTKRVEYVLGAVHMLENKDEKIGSFSGGMKQRIGIAQILLHLPKILVVDEPTAGLDPRERIRFRNLLVELSKERIVIFSTHIIEDVASSCNMVAVMKKGEVKYLGAPIKMAKIAEEKVWMLNIPANEFDEFKDNIVSHDMIYLKCTENVIPMPSNFVDILFTLNALDHVDNFSYMCLEIMRILKPGGEFIGSFNLEEPATPYEPQQLNEKRIKENLLNDLVIQSYRITQKGPEEDLYAPFFNGNLSYQLGQEGFLWVRAKKPN